MEIKIRYKRTGYRRNFKDVDHIDIYTDSVVIVFKNGKEALIKTSIDDIDITQII